MNVSCVGACICEAIFFYSPVAGFLHVASHRWGGGDDEEVLLQKSESQ